MEAGGKRLMHRRLYKNARGRTPPWKDVYRQRCMDRLRSNRSQLVEHFRSAGNTLNKSNNPATKIVQDVMEIEWAVMNQGTSLPLFKKVPHGLDDSGEGDQAVLLAIMEDIQQDLITEGKEMDLSHEPPTKRRRRCNPDNWVICCQLLNSSFPFVNGPMLEEEKLLIDVLNYDAAVLASQVASQQSEEVICPVCQVQELHESPTRPGVMMTSTVPSEAGPAAKILVCGCGLALQGTNLTLNTVKSSLENTISHHGQTCLGQMVFTPTTDTQGANVLITCNICDWMSFLL